MASTTTNLGLMKPAYSDDADISDINGNMDLIDAEAGRVRANVAANYDSSETYAVGDYCLHDGSLYKCSTAISSPEAWTAGHWTQIKITGELATLNGKITWNSAGSCAPGGSINKPSIWNELLLLFKSEDESIVYTQHIPRTTFTANPYLRNGFYDSSTQYGSATAQWGSSAIYFIALKKNGTNDNNATMTLYYR